MAGNDLNIRIGSTAVEFRLGDFNRLRWTVQALRWRPQLLHSVHAHYGAKARIMDSKRLPSLASEPLPAGSMIVLWDGLNSWVELQAERPDLRNRTDLRYLFVGCFPDISTGFASNSTQLFPDDFPRQFQGPETAIGLPLHFKATETFRRRTRPLKNAVLSPIDHQRLQQGGCLVFCGLVRPSAAVLDGFFRGVSFPALRISLQPLVGLDWRNPEGSFRSNLKQAFTLIREQYAQSEQDSAALYSVINVIHRMATLYLVNSITPSLMVNEYGIQPHFDPYDAYGYANNLFIDFGSSRGPDLVYPRTVDLWATGKRRVSLRLLKPGNRLAEFLITTNAEAFWDVCEAHANSLLSALGSSHLDPGRGTNVGF